MLTVSDDGRGVDLDRLRVKVVERNLATVAMVESFSEAELAEFLFLPGFSTAAKVTDISGRGVGLDAVQEMAKSVGGAARLTARTGQGLALSSNCRSRFRWCAHWSRKLAASRSLFH